MTIMIRDHYMQTEKPGDSKGIEGQNYGKTDGWNLLTYVEIVEKNPQAEVPDILFII